MSVMIPILLVSACKSVGSGDAICDSTSQLRTRHAAALVADGGDQSVVTGHKLIVAIDTVCGV